MRIFLSLFIFLILPSCFAQISLLNEDFQAGIPLSFSILDLDENEEDPSMIEFLNNSAWVSLSDPDNTSNGVAASTSFFSPIDTANRWLITPQLTLGSFGNILNWKAKSHDPSFPDDYVVLVSFTDASPESFVDTIGFVEEENFEWTQRTVNLSEKGYDDSSIYIAFVLRTFDGFKLYIDDITVEKEVDTNSIYEINYPKITLFPNPTSQWLNISGINQSFNGEIRTLHQQLVKQFNNSTIDLQDIPAGVYLLSIRVDDLVIKKRFIKN